MKIKQSSWHYKLIKRHFQYVPDNTCDYAKSLAQGLCIDIKNIALAIFVVGAIGLLAYIYFCGAYNAWLYYNKARVPYTSDFMFSMWMFYVISAILVLGIILSSIESLVKFLVNWFIQLKKFDLYEFDNRITSSAKYKVVSFMRTVKEKTCVKIEFISEDTSTEN